MKKLFLLFFAIVGGLAAQSELNLESHGKITVYFPEGWHVDVGDFGLRKIVTITPANEAVNATCTLTVTYPENDRLSDKARLKQRVEADGKQIAEGSVEGKAVAKEYNLRSGIGFYCNFTDPQLVGKRPQKGNFKVISGGLIMLAPDVMVEVAISSDGFNTGPHQDLLGAIEGMDYERAKRR